ncbi:hypothetical protein E4U40_007559 [Claviceps sp. LM458 group G5]|nr:hypothetical protein E4U40_007559 [Claviceps sp. LM458 group G5]KAG6050985.1 hypothetical protein E4U39_002489 [Claviceps sp. Clav50 group G5]
MSVSELSNLELRANGQKTAIEDAHERALDVQITADKTKDAVQELRTAIPYPIAAQEALTATQPAQSQLIANLNLSSNFCVFPTLFANAEGDHESRKQSKEKILKVVSTPRFVARIDSLRSKRIISRVSSRRDGRN